MAIKRIVIRPTASGEVFIRAKAEQINAKVTRQVERSAVRRVPVDTGELRESIWSWSEGLIGRVMVGTGHWPATEYGSHPHTIRSTGPWSLHNRETGEYFGRVVHHPGTPEQPFMRPAIYTKRAIS